MSDTAQVLPQAALAHQGVEDVAERGAGVGRAVGGHRLLLLVDLLRLHRELHAARAAVDLGDLGVDLLAHREAVRTLVAAVAVTSTFLLSDIVPWSVKSTTPVSADFMALL